MRFVLTATCLILALTVNAKANETVSDCTFESMKWHTFNGLKAAIVSAMKNLSPPIEVTPEDVTIIDKGVLEFDEYGKMKLEHAWEVYFQTKKGTSLSMISAVACGFDDCPEKNINFGVYRYYVPRNFVVSIPAPKIFERYDNEGNLIARMCGAYLADDGFRSLLVFNIDTKVFIHRNEFASYRPLVEVEIK